jgi:ATP-dependent Clp protease, protease subunit
MTVMSNGEMILYGMVGDSYWGEGFTAGEVVQALAEHGRDQDITVRINSGGGYVDDGVAIYNALAAHKGEVTVVVDAMAASSASLIAMAGDKRVMRKGAMLMIHDPSTAMWGTAEDMERARNYLEKQAESFASIYADASGDDVADVRAEMKAELWMTADEAVERGFATSVAETKSRAVAAFDYRAYAHAPEKLAVMSAKKGWGRDRNSPAAASATASTRHPKETAMTDKTEADKTTANLDDAVKTAKAEATNRIKAIMTCDEAKGREKLAEHFAYSTEMSADDAIAALKVASAATAENDNGGGAEAYATARLAAAALAGGGGKPAATASVVSIPKASAVFDMRRNALKGA